MIDDATGVTEDIGGVQGTPPEDAAGTDTELHPPHLTGPAPEQPAPDAAEIEWTDLTRKPPAPENGT